MAKQIYSFTKIEKKRTNSGVIAGVMGIISIIGLILLITAAVVQKGQLPFWIAGFGLITLIIAAGGFVLAWRARKNDDTFGKFLNASYLLCAAGLILHGLIILVGIMAIIA